MIDDECHSREIGGRKGEAKFDPRFFVLRDFFFILYVHVAIHEMFQEEIKCQTK